MAQGQGLEVTHTYQNALEGFAAEIPDEQVDDVRSDPRVEFVAQDRVVKATAQRNPTSIDRVEADQSPTAVIGGDGDSVNADIAILDTGIYKKHRDLKISGDRNCTSSNMEAYSDGNGHGTHVAGSAAAKDDTRGVVGVAPGARLWAVKVLNKNGSGTFSSIICGIDWVTGKAGTIEVANMSLGATVSGSDDGNCDWTGNNAAAVMHQAICNLVNAGVFYAVAAGNDSKDFVTDVPAAFDEVLTVTAMADFDGKPGSDAFSSCRPDNADDTAASFSNYTTTTGSDDDHTIAAPGVCIMSTWNNGRYKTISGTSMASPHVAGTAALCIAARACARNNPTSTMTKLRNDAEDKSDLTTTPYYGFVGDPKTAPTGPYYGYLEHAGDY
jgi:subtilisin family serine protease